MDKPSPGLPARHKGTTSTQWSLGGATSFGGSHLGAGVAPRVGAVHPAETALLPVLYAQAGPQGAGPHAERLARGIAGSSAKVEREFVVSKPVSVRGVEHGDNVNTSSWQNKTNTKICT